MLNKEVVEVGGKDVVVKEVSPRQIINLLPSSSARQKKGEDQGDQVEKGEDQGDQVEKGFMANVEDLMHGCCGLGVEDLLDLKGSEIEKLWEAFRKVNSFFFKTAEMLSRQKRIKEGLDTLVSHFGGTFAGLWEEAMADVSTTGGPGSSVPSKTQSDSENGA